MSVEGQFVNGLDMSGPGDDIDESTCRNLPACQVRVIELMLRAREFASLRNFQSAAHSRSVHTTRVAGGGPHTAVEGVSSILQHSAI